MLLVNPRGKNPFCTVSPEESHPAGDTGFTRGDYLRERSANFAIILGELTGLPAHWACKFGVMVMEGLYHETIHAYGALDDGWIVDAMGVRNLELLALDYGRPAKCRGQTLPGDPPDRVGETIWVVQSDQRDEMEKLSKRGKIPGFKRGERVKLRAFITTQILPELAAHTAARQAL